MPVRNRAHRISFVPMERKYIAILILWNDWNLQYRPNAKALYRLREGAETDREDL